MLENSTFSATTDFVIDAAKETLSNVRENPFFTLSDLHRNVRWGIGNGVHDLTRAGVVIGGIAVAGSVTYGVVKGSEFLSNQGSKLARKLRHRSSKAASWAFNRNAAEDTKKSDLKKAA